MKPVLSREQMRAFDSYAVEARGVPAMLLMENAGRGAADLILKWTQPRSDKAQRPVRVCILTGAGNNGGDGYVVARRLLVHGVDVRVIAVVDRAKLRGEARAQADAFCGCGGVLLELAQVKDPQGFLREEFAAASHIVDALFGTGLARSIDGIFRTVIEALAERASQRDSRACVIALDLPSGIDANTGKVLGTAVKAERTITFAHMKLGLLTPSGADHAGEISVVDIGVPASCLSLAGTEAQVLDQAAVGSALWRRDASVHKARAGRVFVFAGSPGKIGAALLCGAAALRAGAGLVTLAGSAAVVALLDGRVLELMTETIELGAQGLELSTAGGKLGSLVIGPGLGLGDAARSLVERVFTELECPKVVDADALTLMSGKLTDFRSLKGPFVLTPHPGEMGRLLGMTSTEVENDRFAAAARAAELSGAVVVLKGAHTVIASPEGRLSISPWALPALATAGAGDVLAGALAALAVELPPRLAAECAVYAHALAAQLWSQAHAQADRGLVAHELADYLPGAIAELTVNTGFLSV